MSSLFNKDPDQRTPLDPYSKERIAKEIGHLEKRQSVRHSHRPRRSLATTMIVFGVVILFSLYFMDPVVYSFKRTDAINSYLYLHSFGSEQKVREIAATGIFTANEIDRLNHRQGAFQDYFATPTAADQTADSVIRYMKRLIYLHDGIYEKLDIIGKIRYQLFVRWGLPLPTHWAIFDPSVDG